MLLVIQVFKSNAHFELHAYFSQPGNYGYIKEGKKKVGLSLKITFLGLLKMCKG